MLKRLYGLCPLRDWQLDLYVGLAGLTPLALFWLLYWELEGYPL